MLCMQYICTEARSSYYPAQVIHRACTSRFQQQHNCAESSMFADTHPDTAPLPIYPHVSVGFWQRKICGAGTGGEVPTGCIMMVVTAAVALIHQSISNIFATFPLSTCRRLAAASLPRWHRRRRPHQQQQMMALTAAAVAAVQVALALAQAQAQQLQGAWCPQGERHINIHMLETPPRFHQPAMYWSPQGKIWCSQPQTSTFLYVLSLL